MNLRSLNPRQKKILLALLAGGGLALVALLGRGRSTGTAAATDAGVLATPSYGSAGTFADNGGQAAGLSSDVTSGLGDVAWALQTLPDQVGAAVRDNQPIYEQPAAVDPSEWAAAFWAGQPAQAATPSGAPNSTATKSATSAKKATSVAAKAPSAAQTKAAAKPNVSFQDSGTRAGLNFQTVVKDKKVYRFYESKPGKGDWGTGDKVYVRPQS